MGATVSKPTQNKSKTQQANNPKMPAISRKDVMPPLLADVENLVLSYWNGDSKEAEAIRAFEIPKLNNPHLSFYRTTLGYTRLSAEYLVQGNADKVMEMVAAHPEILADTVEVRDLNNRRLKGDLLQIAAIAGSFNLRPEMKEDHGITEQLSNYALRSKLFTQDQVNERLAAVFPANWKEITKKRMQRYEAAYKALGEAIIAGEVPTNKAAREACPAVKAFREAIKANEEEVITTGLVFDPEVIKNCIQYFIDHLGAPGARGTFEGWNAPKSALYWIIAVGSLQALVSADDAQVFRAGLYNVEAGHKTPKRLLTLKDGSPYFRRGSEGLGVDYFLDDIGRAREKLGLWAVSTPFGEWGILGKFMSSKNISVATLMQRSDQPAPTQMFTS